MQTIKAIKSRQRVIDHGEVFTAEREVNAMLQLVQHETERADSRFLEPACGTGNFLVPLLVKKLAIIKKRYAKSQLEFERYSVIAVASIYGIDILEDNVKTCRDRLYEVFNEIYSSLYKKKCKDSCRASIRFILDRNILWGNALSLKTADPRPMPIIFSEWSLVRGSMIKRRDYTFEELVPGSERVSNLFKLSNTSDMGTPVFIPESIKEYPLTHFLEIAHADAE